MATTTTTTNGGRARPRVHGSGRDARSSDGRERQYDLLTAALVGAAVGAGTAFLLRRGPSGERPLKPAWRVARAGAKLAGRGARYAWDRGVDAWDALPREEIADHVRDYVDGARETIEDVMHSELKDLRRSIRRQRKKLGL